MEIWIILLIIAIVYLYCTCASAKAVDKKIEIITEWLGILEEDIRDVDDMYSDYLIRHAKNKDSLEDLQAIRDELASRRAQRRNSNFNK